MPVERFDDYMHRCLYGDQGFYTTGRGVAGRRSGDFITSPEVGPLFGAVLARWLDARWAELGQPAPFRVIDAGTGPGALLRSLERARPTCSRAWELIGVDPAIGTVMPSDLGDAVVIANELLDNLVVRLLERQDDGWVEIWVDTDGPRPVECLEPLGTDDAFRLPAAITGLPVGSRTPWHETGARWVEEVLDRGAASVLAIDYGARTTAELIDRGGWLRTYRKHHRGNDPYIEAGSADITVDVAFDQLPGSPALSTQREFLTEHGIGDLVDEGRQYWAANAATPDLHALMMRSRIAEADALLDPNGLGDWIVASWSRSKQAPGVPW